jgi:CheY-like chemotaxis protein
MTDHLCRVFVVDDDEAIRDSLCEILNDEGYDVVCVANGAEALIELQRYVARHEQPCVILLDLMMPVMNGYDFRLRQQEDPGLGKIPVVVISAHGSPHSISANGFLPKPLHLDRLLSTVHQFCRPEG